MIAFDLQCSGGHKFEGWFRSSADFDAQAAKALIPCPLCGDCGVAKAVMAPNIGRKGNQLAPQKATTAPPSAAPAAAPTAWPTPADAPMIAGHAMPPAIAAMAAALAAAQAAALPKSTWVGDKFADHARAMHEGSEDQGLIHGQATRAEAEALVEDGIPVLPLLVPVVPPGRQN